MRTIALADVVTITRRDDRQFTVASNISSLPTDESNLAVRAALALRRVFPGGVGGWDIVIEKRVPHGAGLGGGSADAAAMLRLLRYVEGLDIDDDALAETGAQVGSDVPFLVAGGTIVASGRGEQLRHVDCPFTEGAIVLVCPSVEVSTPDAYRWWDTGGKPRTEGAAVEMVAALFSGDWSRVVAGCDNAFQTVVEAHVPEIAEVRQTLVAAGCETAVMSGSGSAVFGLVSSLDAARRIADDLSRSFPLAEALSFPAPAMPPITRHH